MSSLPEQPFTAYVGIDWVDRKHDICVQAAGDTRRESSSISHQVAAIDEWANALHGRFGGPIAVALELVKGPIVAALQKYEFLVLFPINPVTLAKYREAFQPSGAKDDPGDAELALDLLVRHPERFSALRPQSAAMRSLVSLVERRRQLVGDRIRLTNRLCDTLKQYYPQALEWFDDRGTVLFCDFLDRWPTLRSVKQARTASLEAFFHVHHCRSVRWISARVGSIRSATALTEDPAVIGPCRLHVRALVAQLRAVLAAIVQFDGEIAAVARTLPDYALFDSLPGAGVQLAPRLVAAFG
jgi:transposase